MKNRINFYLILILSFFIFQSCTDKDDNLLSNELRVYDFIWKGMNQYYLWQSDVPDLADDKFATQTDLNSFLYGYSQPEDLFSHLKVDGTIDRFSVIFSDYRDLQGILQGNTRSNGVVYGLKFKTGSTTDLFGWVKYILPNSDASSKNIIRGSIFYAVNNVNLNINNYRSLLANDSYTLNLANYDNGNITPNSIDIALTKNEYSQNPVLINRILNINAMHKAGYLMYNGFFSSYETQLNNAFQTFQAANVTDLIIDLRYNSGGSIDTATRLASMITGQFNNQVFAKQQWNNKIQSQNDPSTFLNLFTNTLGNGNSMNSLSLNRVYIISTKETASASEMLLHCLKPYITVVQVGATTTGKDVGSITLYDSPSFSIQEINPNHRYAIQPIVLKIQDKNGLGDYQSGITPDFQLSENIGDLKILGNVNEPLLSLVITRIIASNRQFIPSSHKEFEDFKQPENDINNQMYLEKVPQQFLNNLK